MARPGQSCVFLLLWLALRNLASAEVALSGVCREFKVYILSYNELAQQLGRPECVAEDKVVVAAKNGIVYVQEDEHLPGSATYSPEQDVHHSFGTHAGPWLFSEALKTSGCTVTDINKAQAVYVDLYCPYISWLGTLHHHGRNITATPGDDILKAYELIVKQPRWQKHGGRDYIFFDPHPGFAAGRAENEWLGAWCHTLKNSVQLVADRGARHYCEDTRDMPGLLGVPYVPNVIDVRKPWETLRHPLPHLHQRGTLIYSSARCADEEYHNNGLYFRTAVWEALHGVAKDVEVECTNPEKGGKHVSFKDMLHKMEHTVFCLALAGDSPSTRRLSEIFMAGSIPVVMGPPFNSLPLSHLIDYSDIGVVFNITGPTPWIVDPYQKMLELPSDAPNSSYIAPLNIIQVPDIASIQAHLRDMPEAEKSRKLRRMKALRLVMTYSDNPTGSWDANSAILAAAKGIIHSCCS